MAYPETIKVRVKTFGPIDESSQEYTELRKKLADHKRFRVWDLESKCRIRGGVFHINTKHLFNNQSVTKEGLRIFDFADYSRHPSESNIRYGHYIENLDELNAARAEQFKCGYCGARRDGAQGQWCISCRGSQYLEPAQYALLEMRAVSDDSPRDSTVPLDVIRDIECRQAAAARKRVDARIEAMMKAAQQKVIDATREVTFLRICVDAGIGKLALDNLIYYRHSDSFCFGWRERVSPETARKIDSALGEHKGRYNVTIKVAGGE